MSSPAKSPPKTREEELEEELREVDAKLKTFKSLFEAKVTPETAREGLKRAEAKLANAKGYGTYIQFGSKKILGSDTLEALLEEEEHLELLLKLRNNQPHGKVMRLLRKKNKIQRALMEERSK